MKNFAAVVFTAYMFFACTAPKTVTQTKEVVHSYETSFNRGKVLKGVLTRTDIESDTAFKWFHENMKLGRADAAAVDAFKKHGSDIKMVIFGGTWCEDTQNLLPLFYRLADKSGFPDSSISLLGVDRAKTTVGNLNKAFNILKVPTFIVMKEGKEMGRVVEYGNDEPIDKQIGDIVIAAFKN